MMLLNSFISLLGKHFSYKDRNQHIEKHSHLKEKRSLGSFEAHSLKI